jgi:hypothetical protein
VTETLIPTDLPPLPRDPRDVVDRLCEGPLDGEADADLLAWLGASLPEPVVSELQEMAERLMWAEDDLNDLIRAVETDVDFHMPSSSRFLHTLERPWSPDEAKTLGEQCGRLGVAVARHAELRDVLRRFAGAVLEQTREVSR